MFTNPTRAMPAARTPKPCLPHPSLSLPGMPPPLKTYAAWPVWSGAAQALKDGRLDAFAIDAALPSRILRGLAAAGVPLRLIPTGEAVARIAERHGPFYFRASIPKGTYRGVEADISAAAGMTLFVAHEMMAESLAYEITKVLRERTPELASAVG
jgi:TRAP-type uncharacterized transport system substrate-binding protein